MTHRLATNYAKNYCNRTPVVKVIVENVVTCFFGTRCRSSETACRLAVMAGGRPWIVWSMILSLEQLIGHHSEKLTLPSWNLWCHIT